MKKEENNLVITAANFFRIVGDETRMKILYILIQGEMCVTDIAKTLDMTKSAVSHQLRLLKTEGLVKGRRYGKNIFYSLDDQHVVDILDIAFCHIKHRNNH